MPRQYQPLEIKSFAKGLVTEANPLEFPENASIDEVNFEINNDKSRQRRLGMDLESNAQWVPTTDSVSTTSFNSILWENAGGNPETKILVVQVDRSLMFFDTSGGTLSRSLIQTIELSNNNPQVEMTVVDSYLVIVDGADSFKIYQYENGSVTQTEERLLIRDTFGLSDFDGNTNLRESSGLTRRPTSLSDNHLYNLRNQTFALPRHNRDANSRDPLRIYHNEVGGWPSNADSVFDAFYENVASDQETMKKYYAEDVKPSPLGSFQAPKGFFIIDALDRGSSREDAYYRLMSDNNDLQYTISGLAEDRTPGGPSCVAQYGGRVWFGGFSGEVEGGDIYSPRMSSYILYSRLVRSSADINKCYQESDPAGYDAPDLVDTDGGFIRIDGAYGINRMYNIGRGLIVIATNGIWMVSGGNDYGFSATNNQVEKISEHGSRNKATSVLVDNTVMYWGDDGIYHIQPNQYGDYVAQNVSEQSVQSLYDTIDSVEKLNCQAQYDSYDRKVRWVYKNNFNSLEETEELILDISAGAFIRSKIGYSDSLPLKVVMPIEVPPYVRNLSDQNVVYNSEVVTYNGETVTQAVEGFSPVTRELKFLVARLNNGLEISFGSYSNSSFYDWEQYDGQGIDAEAYMLTGWVSGGDNMRMKQTPYMIMHMERTETGFYEDENGDLFPVNPSSCIIRPQWEWTDSPESGKWGRPFQAYRYKRPYFATGTQDNFETGDRLIVTKNKLRGRGRVVSLDIRTEPGMNCHIYGWGMIVGVNNNV